MHTATVVFNIWDLETAICALERDTVAFVDTHGLGRDAFERLVNLLGESLDGRDGTWIRQHVTYHGDIYVTDEGESRHGDVAAFVETFS